MAILIHRLRFFNPISLIQGNVVTVLFPKCAMATDGMLDVCAASGWVPALVGHAKKIVREEFASPPPSGAVGQTLCRYLGNAYLVPALKQPAWHDTTGWVHALALGTSAQRPQSHPANSVDIGFRVVQCGTGTGSPPWVEGCWGL